MSAAFFEGLTLSRVWNLVQRFAVWALIVSAPAYAQDLQTSDNEISAAQNSVLQGHVKDGIEKLVSLLAKTDPSKDQIAYWRIGTILVEFLSETENHSEAAQIISKIISTKIAENNLVYRQWVQFYIGRNLAYSGHASEGEKYLRAATAGDSRLVHNPAQRAAAIVLSRINLDRNDVRQAGIWIRRAVIGSLVDRGVGSEEIIDALTAYADFLARTRRLPEAYALFVRLAPFYDSHLAHRGPKYLSFVSRYLNTTTSLGNFASADVLNKVLKDDVAAVDVAANSVREELFFQELYQLGRTGSIKNNGLTDRLKQIVADYPNFLKSPRNRAVFSYFSLLGGDVELADKFLSAVQGSAPSDEQFEAYETVLRSFILAQHGHYDESIEQTRSALEKIERFHHLFEIDSSTRLPAISIEERAIFSLSLGFNASHVSKFENADVLFRVAQYLNRDKGKLGLAARVSRQKSKSSLDREDIRSRDRLEELRERMMQDAVESLLNRILPIRNYSPPKSNDYSALIRLEDIEDRIARANDEFNRSVSTESIFNGDVPVGLAEVQRILRPNEALIVHTVAGGGLGMVTTCISSGSWTFYVKSLSNSERQTYFDDSKLLTASVHSKEDPSANSASLFPASSSHRLYQFFFGGVESCLKNKTHILLATDPDFFSVPWNALLTTLPVEIGDFHFKNAAWLSRSYALSLLTSVRSLEQLRENLPPSQAPQSFFGIGAPNFRGPPTRDPQLVLRSLFKSRGAANRSVISELPELPDAADELRTIAKVVGESKSKILLGSRASERELRKQPLDNFRIISFATHAVVAGDIEGVTEPALVFSPGTDEKDQSNDGLLTASEIANLKLDADLIILSACNTAAADGSASGRGLSGLADAFFFAGARTVAVTQWEVFSFAAKRLGAGLIEYSINRQGIGVAEGLRESMLAYISSAPTDDLAHPRFWAPFIIAGDGSVGPLDGEQSEPIEPISVLSDQVLGSPADSEIISLTKVANVPYGIGVEKPDAGRKVAGSYYFRIPTGNQTEIMKRDENLAASSIVGVGDDLALLGFIPAGGKSTAVFRLVDANGNLKWEHRESSTVWNNPIGIVKAEDGFVLLTVENSYSGSINSALNLIFVDEHGTVLKRRQFPIPLTRVSADPRKITVDAAGHLLIAITGAADSQPQQKMWINPQTGSKKFCMTSDVTYLMSIDLQKNALWMHKVLADGVVSSLRTYGDRSYAAVVVSSNCHLEHGVRMITLTPDLQIKTLFQHSNVNSLEAYDFEVFPGFFVIVGAIKTFLPTALSKEIPTLEQMAKYQIVDPFDDSFWDQSEETGNGFIAVLSKSGKILADRVFPDLRSRVLTNIMPLAGDQYVAAGSALGDRGWAISFTLHEDRFAHE